MPPQVRPDAFAKPEVTIHIKERSYQRIDGTWYRYQRLRGATRRIVSLELIDALDYLAALKEQQP